MVLEQSPLDKQTSSSKESKPSWLLAILISLISGLLAAFISPLLQVEIINRQTESNIKINKLEAIEALNNDLTLQAFRLTIRSNCIDSNRANEIHDKWLFLDNKLKKNLSVFEQLLSNHESKKILNEYRTLLKNFEDLEHEEKCLGYDKDPLKEENNQQQGRKLIEEIDQKFAELFKKIYDAQKIELFKKN